MMTLMGYPMTRSTFIRFSESTMTALYLLAQKTITANGTNTREA